jgi:hypothetical protein
VLLSLAVSISYVSIRLAYVTTRAAEVKANLVYLDPATRQFPLIIQHIHGHRYALHNPNAGSVVMLDARNHVDRQLIAESGAVQIAGVIAQEASKSTDPAGVAIIRPPVIEYQDEQVVIGNNRRTNE